MSAVLVTIVGPGGRADGVAPADAPVAALLPALARLTGTADGAAPRTMELARSDDTALDAGCSLGEQGVVDGDVLRLRGVEAAGELGAAAAPCATDGSSPLDRTGDALPQWLGLAARLRVAHRAARDDSDGPGTSRRARARRAWRASGYEDRLDSAVRERRTTQPFAVGVVSPAACAGRTTVALLLASAFAHLRPAPAIVLDTAPAGACSTRGAIAVDDLAALLDAGFPVPPCAAPVAGGIGVLTTAPGAAAGSYERVIARLREIAQLVVVDCGAGLADGAAQACLKACDRLVVVVQAGPRSAAHVAAAAAELGHGAPPAVLVVNRVPARGRDVAWLAREMPRAAGLVAIHCDRRLARRLATSRSAHGPTRDLAVRELAAVLLHPS